MERRLGAQEVVDRGLTKASAGGLPTDRQLKMKPLPALFVPFAFCYTLALEHRVLISRYKSQNYACTSTGRVRQASARKNWWHCWHDRQTPMLENLTILTAPQGNHFTNQYFLSFLHRCLAFLLKLKRKRLRTDAPGVSNLRALMCQACGSTCARTLQIPGCKQSQVIF